MKKPIIKNLHRFFCVTMFALSLISIANAQPFGHWRIGNTGNPETNPPNPDGVDATNNLLGTPAGVDLRFGTNGGIQRAIITAGGLFGVGTTAPQTKVDISSNSFQLRLSRTSDATSTRFLSNSDDYLVILPSGQRVGINVTPNLATALDIGGRARVRNFSALGAPLGVVLHDANGVLQTTGAGTAGQVLTQTASGPAWQNAVAGVTGPTGATGTTGTIEQKV